MNLKYIAIIILLSAIVASSLVALVYLSYKVLFTVLLVLSSLVLCVYCLFGDNKTTRQSGRKYSDILIADELNEFLIKEKPYLNPNYKISDLEKQLIVSRSAIAAYTKKKYRRSFNQFLNLWRISELQQLQSLPENEGESINKLCKKAGFINALQYYQAEKERKAINRVKAKNKPFIKKPDDNILNELDIKKKPEIQMRI
jgi:hypothetical protein